MLEEGSKLYTHKKCSEVTEQTSTFPFRDNYEQGKLDDSSLSFTSEYRAFLLGCKTENTKICN